MLFRSHLTQHLRCEQSQSTARMGRGQRGQPPTGVAGACAVTQAPTAKPQQSNLAQMATHTHPRRAKHRRTVDPCGHTHTHTPRRTGGALASGATCPCASHRDAGPPNSDAATSAVEVSLGEEYEIAEISPWCVVCECVTGTLQIGRASCRERVSSPV